MVEASPDQLQLSPAETSTPTMAEFAFAKRLGTLHDSSVAPLPDFTAALSHRGTIPAYSAITDRLAGVHFADSVLEPFRAGGEAVPNQLEFTARPLMGLGRQDSWRSVFFGSLTMESRSGAVQEKVDVAVKPFPFSASNHAEQECAIMQLLTARHIDTLDLLGVVVDREADEPMLYMLTRFRPELISMDSLDWTNVDPDTIDARTSPVIATLAALHTELIFHGDPEFKNVGIGDREGSIIMFDMEHAVSLQDAADAPVDEVPVRLVQAMGRDLGSVQKSFTGFIYPNLPEHMRPQNDSERFDYEFMHLFAAYRRAIQLSDSPHKALLDRALISVLERKREDAGLPPDPDMLQKLVLASAEIAQPERA